MLMRPVGDSVLLGAVCVALVAGGWVLALSLDGWTSPQQWAVGGPALLCIAPQVAVLNLVFVYRDRKRGMDLQADIGLGLSGVAFVLSIFPLLLAD
jgi:hypothetical protein